MEETIEELKEKIRLLEKTTHLYRQTKDENDALRKKLSSARNLLANVVDGTDNQWQAFYDFKRTVMADLIIDGVDEETFWSHYKYNSEYTTLQKSALKEGAYESQDFFKGFGETGMWLLAAACPLTDENGDVIGAIEIFQDVTRLINAQKESRKNQPGICR